jgi:hypothetical protein
MLSDTTNGWEWLLCAGFCGAGILLAAWYLLASRPGSVRKGIWQFESGGALDTRMRRRRLGAALLVAINAALFVGINVLQPAHHPVGYIMYWLIVMVMLAWLVGLGVADLLQTRRTLRRSSRREQDRDDD